jgi:hypothetical protein
VSGARDHGHTPTHLNTLLPTLYRDRSVADILIANEPSWSVF